MQLLLRATGILGIVISVIWWFAEPSYDPLYAFITGITALLGSFILPGSNSQGESLDQRNRRVMLNHVENFWVKGVLEKSLHGAALLELGIKEDPSAVNYPWTIKRESTNETLPRGKSMLEVFQEIGMGRSLLVLGAPGSGKTTVLLELARQFIECARQDETEPVPVVFNLASWTEKQWLSDWLAAQLNVVYNVPKTIAPLWVQGDKVLLLLDGLDEVQEDYRAKCVDAINQFRDDHGLTSVVVCCREQEYWGAASKLQFDGAIAIQPLTSDKVNQYIDRFGKKMSGLKLALRKDKLLVELAETPLMLSIMTLAYQSKKSIDLLDLDTVENRRKHLFNSYIGRMFERSTRATNKLFPKDHTLKYLNWLARTMVQHNITTYHIESMQPVWLQEKAQQRLYGLLTGVIGGLFGWLVFGGIGGLILGLIRGRNGDLIEGVGFGLRFGLILGLFICPFTGFLVWQSCKQRESIVMIDKLKWSWKDAGKGVLMGIFIGFWSGVLLMLIFVLFGAPDLAVSLGIPLGIVGAVTFVPTFGLLWGLSPRQIQETAYPGQRLKQTFLNASLANLIVGLLFSFVVGAFGLRLDRPVFWAVLGLLLGILCALLVGLYDIPFAQQSGSSLPLIQHFSLRWVIIRHKLLPRRLAPFLEYCVSLIFLRRVGGGYIFVHRLLMEHFAKMDV